MIKKRILIVDDDKAVVESFKAILQLEGYLVETAENGREALEKCGAGFFNVVLLSIELPDMEGTKLLPVIRGIAPQMIKIMVTGHASLENAVESLNQGADAYLIKPVKPEELLKVIEEKLKEQEEAGRVSEEKIAEWIERRVKELEQERKTDPNQP